mmetsp:Transcript_1127/g.3361  ORF Transcript_1127/g.3361 Transcript_1127/m.3361 type:complete len:291 (-) Transcript_1127:4-876(-)
MLGDARAASACLDRPGRSCPLARRTSRAGRRAEAALPGAGGAGGARGEACRRCVLPWPAPDAHALVRLASRRLVSPGLTSGARVGVRRRPPTAPGARPALLAAGQRCPGLLVVPRARRAPDAMGRRGRADLLAPRSRWAGLAHGAGCGPALARPPARGAGGALGLRAQARFVAPCASRTSLTRRLRRRTFLRAPRPRRTRRARGLRRGLADVAPSPRPAARAPVIAFGAPRALAARHAGRAVGRRVALSCWASRLRNGGGQERHQRAKGHGGHAGGGRRVGRAGERARAP